MLSHSQGRLIFGADKNSQLGQEAEYIHCKFLPQPAVPPVEQLCESNHFRAREHRDAMLVFSVTFCTERLISE